MSKTDRALCRRLVLQIERDLAAQTHLRILLAAAETTIAGDRQELRTVKARLGRTGSNDIEDLQRVHHTARRESD